MNLQKLELILNTLPLSNAQMLDDLLMSTYNINISQINENLNVLEDENVMSLLDTSLYIKGLRSIQEKIKPIIFEMDEEEIMSDDYNKMLELTYDDLVGKVGYNNIEGFKQALEDVPEKVHEDLLAMYYQDNTNNDKRAGLKNAIEEMEKIGYERLYPSIRDLDFTDQSFIVNELYKNLDNEKRFMMVKSLLECENIKNLTLHKNVERDLKTLVLTENENILNARKIAQVDEMLNKSEDNRSLNLSKISELKTLKYLNL